MIHVYGTLGEIDGPVPFGAAEAPIADISRTLRTYHDGVVDEDHARLIQSTVKDAERLIFLGFGFHPENVKLLFPEGPPRARMIGTSVGCPKVPPFSEIAEAPGSSFFEANPTSFLRSNGFALMREPWTI